VKVPVEGQLVFNNITLVLHSAVAGFGRAYLPEDEVQRHLAAEHLIQMLDEWCPPFSGLPKPSPTHASLLRTRRCAAVPPVNTPVWPHLMAGSSLVWLGWAGAPGFLFRPRLRGFGGQAMQNLPEVIPKAK
jgi:hypothetical protein